MSILTRDANAAQGLATQHFVLDALNQTNRHAAKRLDCRLTDEMRNITFQFRRGDAQASVEVLLGTLPNSQTRVMTVVTGDLICPFADRPTEGQIMFNVDLSPMASPNFETGKRSSPVNAELQRLVDRLFREGNVLDNESLCVTAGEKVWRIRCNVHVLDDGGNLADAIVLSIVGALQHFRRPDVTAVGGQTHVHSIEDRDPIPLALHFIPVAVTFALYENHQKKTDADGAASERMPIVLVDPNEMEEHVMGGKLTLCMNTHGELCAVSKLGGLPITEDIVMHCANIAAEKVSNIHHALVSALQNAEETSRKDLLNRLRGQRYVEGTTVPFADLSGGGAAATPPAATAATPAFVEEQKKIDAQEAEKFEQVVDFAVLHTPILAAEEKEGAKQAELDQQSAIDRLLKTASRKTEEAAMEEGSSPRPVPTSKPIPPAGKSKPAGIDMDAEESDDLSSAVLRKKKGAKKKSKKK